MWPVQGFDADLFKSSIWVTDPMLQESVIGERSEDRAETTIAMKNEQRKLFKGDNGIG